MPGSVLVTGVEPRTDLVPGVALHAAVATWFERRFPGPTPPQAEGWPHIAAGSHTLIAAPTGSGKTLAGFLMAINRLYLAHAAGQPVDGARVAYVSPLKALAVDIAENLERPLAEIAATAAALGLEAPELAVGVRTGDTTSSARAAMVRRPPTFVVTTPESLYLLLTAARSREVLRSVDTVIVDEIHALARDKRGAHLTLSLERLTHVCATSPVRVGLSATQKPMGTIARLLVGTRATSEGAPACVVVDAGHQRHLDLEVELPGGELEAVVSNSQMGAVLDRIAELVRDHRTTLVFVNTRRLAERLAHQLGDRLGDDVVAAHHGSLSKDRRQRVERRLRAGDLKALVATASLELGIDVGPVELVCQIGSPRSIATFLQRVGRSNHTRAGTPKGRLYPLTRDELVESAALMAGVRAGRLDAVCPPEAPLDILAQQIVAETAAEAWRTDDLFDLVRRAHPYRRLPRATFDEVLRLTSDGIQTGRGRRAAHVHLDTVNGEVRARRGARLAALTSGGAIPEMGDFKVVAEPDETLIGTVNEDWATESMAGDIFLLGTHSWQIRQVSGGEVRVVDAGDKPPTIPFWLGEAPARTAELSEQVSRLREGVDDGLVAGDPGGARRWVREVSGVPYDAAELIVDYLAAGKAVLGVMPTQDGLVLERFFDETGGTQVVIHSPHGGRINRAMGFALRKKLCRTFDFELQASADDDAVVISLGPHHSFPLSGLPRFLTSSSMAETLTQAVLDQPIFLSRWRWNLNRALVVLRFRNGTRTPPPIQRMQADDVMAAVFPAAAACQENVTGPIEVPDHPLVRQTVHDTLTEGLDVDGLTRLWERIEGGEVRVHHRETTEPSPLAHEILTARPYAFLDDGEALDRRTNAVPLRRGLPVDPTGIGHLDPAAVAQVRDETTPRPATPDELHDVLAALVLTSARPEWGPLFAELERRGRVGRHHEGGGERWHTTEAAGDVRALLDAHRGGGASADRVAVEVVRGHLELHSPVTAGRLAGATGLAESTVAVGLAALEAEGFAIQGRFSPGPSATGPPEVEWCSRRLLARIHAYSRRRRRREVEPVSAEQFVRFLLRWQHVAPGSQAAGPGGLAAVLEQLQGHECPAAVWESQVLARRVRGYQPAWIDELCHGGELTWLRLTPRSGADPDRRGRGPSKSTPISLVFRAELPWLLASIRGPEVPAPPVAGALAEVLEALQANGARFPVELAADTGRLATDIESALWEGVARGLLASDGFEAIRALTGPARGARSRASRRHLSRLRGGAPRGGGAGRWSIVPPPPAVEGVDELAEALADQLLQRWGVVFFDMAAHEAAALRWRDLQRALRRLEDRGLVRGGRFVKGFSGEQFALPQAVEGLKAIRRHEPTGATVTLCAADPLNLTGVVLPGDRTPSRRTETVTLPL